MRALAVCRWVFSALMRWRHESQCLATEPGQKKKRQRDVSFTAVNALATCLTAALFMHVVGHAQGEDSAISPLRTFCTFTIY